MNSTMILTIAVFVAIYAAITTEIVNKTAAALFGAMLMVMLGVISQEDAFRYIDLNVIFLLIGMMILTGITKRTGLFQFMAIKLAKLAKGEPIAILILLAAATALVSAFLDNVTTVLILVPITFLIAVELDVRPEPFVIVLAMASNVGGTATLIGDPPNIMIGSAAGLGFTDFLLKLSPVILVILAALCAFVWLVFRKELVVSAERKARIMAFDQAKAITDKPLLAKSLAVLGMVILGFLLHDRLGLGASTLALAGAALLLAISGFKDVEEIFGEIEWTTIMFFIGLFMLVGALVHVGVMEKLSSLLLGATAGHAKATTLVVLWASGILSAFVDNIPFVATMIPLIKDMGTSLGPKAIEPLWWALSLGACLGGNGTLIGASANVVSAGISGKNGHPISFAYFMKFGATFAFISLLISSAYLLLFF
jgi:Na+/H+ antiporter NhaD/arsenite permease-like protein